MISLNVRKKYWSRLGTKKKKIADRACPRGVLKVLSTIQITSRWMQKHSAMKC